MAAKNDKGALAKIKQIRDQQHERYIENKALGKCKEYDSRRRKKRLWNFIERQIKIENKSVNKHWVKWHKQQMTPLIAVIKQQDVKGVKVLGTQYEGITMSFLERQI